VKRIKEDAVQPLVRLVEGDQQEQQAHAALALERAERLRAAAAAAAPGATVAPPAPAPAAVPAPAAAPVPQLDEVQEPSVDLMDDPAPAIHFPSHVMPAASPGRTVRPTLGPAAPAPTAATEAAVRMHVQSTIDLSELRSQLRDWEAADFFSGLDLRICGLTLSINEAKLWQLFLGGLTNIIVTLIATLHNKVIGA
jgi:hypothetical protein